MKTLEVLAKRQRAGDSRRSEGEGDKLCGARVMTWRVGGAPRSSVALLGVQLLLFGLRYFWRGHGCLLGTYFRIYPPDL